MNILIHHVNALITVFLALCLNTILILLVMKRSPTEMTLYRRILIHTAIVDIVFSVLTLLSGFVVIEYDGWVFGFSVSYISPYLSSTCRGFLFRTWIIAYYFSILGLCVQFIYRYLVINKNVTITLKKYVGALSLVLLIIAFTWLNSYLFEEDRNEKLSLINDTYCKQIEVFFNANISYFLAYHQKIDNFMFKTAMQLSIIENGICYLIIIICAFKIAKFVNKNAYRNATHGQQVHKQLTINLIIKALLPLAMNILNFSVAIQLLFFQTEMSPNFLLVQISASVPAYWLPVLNPLVTICTVSDYRSAVTILIRSTTRSRSRDSGVFAAADLPQIRVIRPTNYANPIINNYVNEGVICAKIAFSPLLKQNLFNKYNLEC